MTAPRPIFAGRFYHLTRRCTQRQYLMRPDDETNNNYLYCLAVAAMRFDINVIVTQTMSNHHHPQVYDRHGNIVDFYQCFNTMFARCQNVLRGRRENFWAAVEPSVVELGDLDTVVDKIVYAVLNPVASDLVDSVHHWPGVPAYQAFLTGKTLTARRPRHFFAQDGDLPETIDITFGFPQELGDASALVDRVRRMVGIKEAEFAMERRAAGKGVLGRRRILRQSWRDSPTTEEVPSDICPRVAARDARARIGLIERNEEFYRAYRVALKATRAGLLVEFPPGTYWLRRYVSVPVQPFTPRPLFEYRG